jgi:hypothetical protein
MTDVTEEPENENEEQEGEEEEEEEDGSKPASLVKSWETDALIVELHGFEDSDELIVTEDQDEEIEEGTLHTIAILSLEEMDEVLDIFAEAREIMAKRQAERKAKSP